MDFTLSEEQNLLVKTVRAFVERELYPFEAEVEQNNAVRPQLAQQIKQRAIAQGLYAANMPEALGGGGLDSVTLTLMERELGRASFALQYLVARPSNILQACRGAQVEEYLLPTIRGERVECLAMTEPDAGSDLRSMKTTAAKVNGGYRINGAKHFISHADIADYVILFAASGEEQTARGPRKSITAFLVDKNTAGFTIRPGYHSVSHAGYHNCILEFDNCRVPASQVLGEEHHGFSVANQWLAATRLQVAAMCLGRAQRALDLAVDWAAQRKQFGRAIGRFQGTSFKLADMATELAAAELLTLRAAWLHDRGSMSDSDAAMAKLYTTEMLARVADHAIQIFGGMGLMRDFPLERIWRDARVERIWEGTSEIQRHIISRAMLRPLE
ncbi:MAG: acyl-CoA dehydrogenase family protein [Gammaproteobacteria bacterium]|nr:acyl-CoA dehydrogenase family protein [Gammaproteobacteria bacterium]MDD9800060.1 acyl-CoA dehydrogenase family protein [Gammaproteobacteria bacterium]MDD9815744.1 acyl-CoA dehydrogenase family protein [Gammaproteobacteria bacterium]MDD9851000.1 acyl-CoA dehydrogenase family protein [Gammaproteobacteria bacterium]MDD9870959.1 acyl-CoA dehydrogenase family protein [Gammaproteobacteria bacterium]